MAHLLALVCLLLASDAARASLPPIERDGGRAPVGRPGPQEYAKMARWLVHVNTWGTVATISRDLHDSPYGNVVSYSDGPLEISTGRPFFYLTDFDTTAQDVEANPTATLNLCEAQIPGSCLTQDPEDPTCSKVSLTGVFKRVLPAEQEMARELVFKRHPAMRDWHAHKFTLYELHVSHIRLLDYYGGYEDVNVQEYYSTPLVLEELKGDPCNRFPHRTYCVEDRYEAARRAAQTCC